VKTAPSNPQTPTTSGFTLLELVVALTIMIIAFSIAFQSFTGTLRGWKRGTEVMDGIKHGDFAMNQLAAAINSTIYFANPRKTYAFKIEKGNADGLPADEISFVTSSSAFMPHHSPLASGPHRIKLFIDDDDRGPALFGLAMPAIADDEEFEDEYDAEPFLATPAIQGLEILLWDKDAEDWNGEWDKENSVPERILLKIFVASEDKNEDPIEFSRMIEIPVFASLEHKLKSPSAPPSINTGGGGRNGNNTVISGETPKTR
jgi:Tfp pilus assembly protein PilE